MNAKNPNQGPASYFLSIEERSGRPVEEWFALIDASGLTKQTEVVNWLKAEHGLGHGHANALAAYRLNPGKYPVFVRPE